MRPIFAGVDRCALYGLCKSSWAASGGITWLTSIVRRKRQETSVVLAVGSTHARHDTRRTESKVTVSASV